MQFLTINKNLNGSYTIKDDVTGEKMTYYFTSMNQAIKEHRKKFNLKYKHFEKIILEV